MCRVQQIVHSFSEETVPHHFSPKSVLSQCRTQQAPIIWRAALCGPPPCSVLVKSTTCKQGKRLTSVRSIPIFDSVVLSTDSWCSHACMSSTATWPECPVWSLSSLKCGACTPSTCVTRAAEGMSEYPLSRHLGLLLAWTSGGSPCSLGDHNLRALESRGKKKGSVLLSHNTNSNAAPEWKRSQWVCLCQLITVDIGSSCGEWCWRPLLYPACSGLFHPTLISHRPSSEVCKVP